MGLMRLKTVASDGGFSTGPYGRRKFLGNWLRYKTPLDAVGDFLVYLDAIFPKKFVNRKELKQIKI